MATLNSGSKTSRRRLTPLAPVLAAALTCTAPLAVSHEIEYSSALSGASESPSNPSAGTAQALVSLDFDLVDLDVELHFNNLSGDVIRADICGPTLNPLTGTAPLAIPLPGFPTNVASGIYHQPIDLTAASSYDPGFIATSGGTVSDALTALYTGLVAGHMYLEIQTTTYPDGEIRGLLPAFPDANHDGTIDTPDFLTVAQNFNVFGTEFDLGDFNIDFVTNAIDFNILATRFGDSAFPAESASPAIVPEPATAMVMCALPMLLFRRACRR
jgi:CHRD domain